MFVLLTLNKQMLAGISCRLLISINWYRHRSNVFTIHFEEMHSIKLLVPILALNLRFFVFAFFWWRRTLAKIFRSSRRMCSVKKGVLRNFAKFTGKHLCQSLFFNKVAGLGPATLLKKRLWHRWFPLNLAKSLRTPFLQNTSGLLLNLLPCVIMFW